ncbi:hypothetical protein [Kitasatospora sp. NBC_01302]|uniref:hypothetical protein n=1 Tax=Kitasatospora sp. NBC_01302 TaxID=2903575 RepID=UPI002E12B309|nr:hypothetical protein OG294_39670 [Kitasatospora sp. NBC_01302]
MSEQRSLDDMLSSAEGMSDVELHRLKCERILGATAIMLHERGHTDASGLLAEVTSLDLDYLGEDWNITQLEAVFDVEQLLGDRFTEELLDQIRTAMGAVVERGGEAIQRVRVRPLIPPVSADWRADLKAAQSGRQSNHARRVRIEPQHPIEDALHFSNEWEQRVYQVLKEQQEALPDNETLGILPLAAMRVLGHTYEPDLLITYRGRAGIIEIDGPHHKGRRSDDASRERLLRNAGVKHIDRLDVRDSTQKPEVEKFVADFLKHLGA